MRHDTCPAVPSWQSHAPLYSSTYDKPRIRGLGLMEIVIHDLVGSLLGNISDAHLLSVNRSSKRERSPFRFLLYYSQ